jgi:hypothetical protein
VYEYMHARVYVYAYVDVCVCVCVCGCGCGCGCVCVRLCFYKYVIVHIYMYVCIRRINKLSFSNFLLFVFSPSCLPTSTCPYLPCQVEWVCMRAMSLGLISGSIDQVTLSC